MKIVEPFFEIMNFALEDSMLMLLEKAGRVCWKSEDKIEADSYSSFVKRLIKIGHESVIEHSYITVKITCDRGITHELVRHRLCSFSQESTRYANYSKGKFGSEITVINVPFFEVGTDKYEEWKSQCLSAEETYMKLLSLGAKPEEARSVLPNSLKTEIVMTANIREWRHIFKLRCADGAHPQMRQIMKPMLIEFAKRSPVLFSDLNEKFNGVSHEV